MNKEYWVPEDIWREIKSYFIVKKFHIGDYLTFFIPTTVHRNEMDGKNTICAALMYYSDPINYSHIMEIISHYNKELTT